MTIKGRTGTVPVGATIQMGRKGAGGRGVVDRDRFSVCLPSGGEHGRELHPAFTGWNQLPVERARSVVCTIAHFRWKDCLHQQLTAWKPPQGASAKPPAGPWCCGDGETAQRWVLQAPDPKEPDRRVPTRVSLPCRPECKFRARRTPTGEALKPDCAPLTVLLARVTFPGFPDVPTPVFRIASRGERSHDAILGLKQDLDRIAEGLNYPDYSPIGYQFTLSMVLVSHAPDPAFPKGRKYWALVASPVVSAMDFLLRQREVRLTLGGGALGDGAPLALPINDDDVLDAIRATEGP